ncbi:unnamed protein product [Trifolium pratense]|uniref:Uncharacterized protein n=1 Tax=Trifolium pratense TaxID=57577 RepID=A0ACB0J647_TRIPR|nr:unnamed protein product [Trifolium pratense]
MLLFTDSLLKFNLFHVFTHTTTLHSTVTVHCRNHFSNLSVSVSNTNQDDSFMLSNIINSAGLSPETSLKLSKKLKLRKYDDDYDGPNTVIRLLRTYGFSATQLSRLVKIHPLVLLSKPEKTLLPKLEFLLSIGVSITDLPKILINNIDLLQTSLEKKIIPLYHTIRSLVHDDKEVVSVLKRWKYNFYTDSMVPNIEVLRNLGVPQRSISLLVTHFPNIAFTKHSRFVEAVNFVKEMGCDPLNSNFVLALLVIVGMSKETWELKLKIFERWGWSKDICILAFQKYPRYMATSEKKIQKIMSFLVNDMGYTPEDIARCPTILNRSMEKTIVPRSTVIKILKSRGLIKSSLSLHSFIWTTEKTFLKRYVTPFQKDLPLLLDAYKGQNSN